MGLIGELKRRVNEIMLIFTNHAAETLRAYARAEYPRECCGIMLGKCKDGRKTVKKIIPTGNEVNGEKNTAHFRIDPLAVLKAEQEPLEILGFYHSHPDCEALPSKEDILHMISGYSYPIVSVNDGECADIRSFERISQTSAETEEEIILSNA